jgi:hypothetical protein
LAGTKRAPLLLAEKRKEPAAAAQALARQIPFEKPLDLRQLGAARLGANAGDACYFRLSK